ncbi:hypothetical protein NMU03_06080 [Allocoprobacillus halotolerans]|uniref:Uncharacterized protein n=1 Tax=Allocoprobacillus halotolerans TaxID=2944914 RepID=A0ABY5I8I4_9FIRM|nr:hypothetical protein [Allocoprobacillus halotolerans]UTY40348.1 hypothetical protein NMU03_06080 [Allocoprobacillus halotolerans]
MIIKFLTIQSHLKQHTRINNVLAVVLIIILMIIHLYKQEILLSNNLMPMIIIETV